VCRCWFGCIGLDSIVVVTMLLSILYDNVSYGLGVEVGSGG